jgi:rhomboid protease GluP
VNPAFPELPGANGRPLAIVGIYLTRTDAYERSLVVSAMEAEHWVLRHDHGFALCVDPSLAPAISAELARFEAERTEPPAAPTPDPPPARHTTISLYLCAWILGAFYLIELTGPGWWLDRGTASSRAIMAGQWWRVFTALTLHADIGHIGANLAAGLIYAAFLLPIFGAGWTWLFILLAGGAGNWLNAWGHRDIDHLSIGASTSVFAALGLLVAAQCAIRVLALRTIRLREFLLPIGAGLGFLAYLGVGDQQTDYMAHCFGFLAGIPFGLAGVWLRLGARTPPLAQALLAWSAPALLTFCWLMAARHP